jgi:hypothetical protein
LRLTLGEVAVPTSHPIAQRLLALRANWSSCWPQVVLSH